MDLCAPTGDLRRCILTGQAGSVVMISAEGQADVTTVLLEGGPAAVSFNGRLGRAYFAVVKPFHRRIVPALLRSVARTLDAEWL